MSDVFEGQTILQLKLDTKIDLSNATVLKILWKRPDKITGATAVTAVEGSIMVLDLSTINITPGKWEFQAYAEIGGKKAFGDIVSRIFKEKLHKNT